MTDLETFRAETRAWLEANCPPEMRQPMQSEKDVCWGGRTSSSSRRRKSSGWSAWPRRAGPCRNGRRHMAAAAFRAKRRRCSRRRCASLGCRPPLQSFGIWMLGPALLKYGSEEQKQTYLPPIVRGEIRWCQGYSEPNAGLRPRRAADQGRGRGRSFPRQRPENLDLLRRRGRLDLLPGAHRFQRAEASRHQLHPLRHGRRPASRPSRSC